MPQIGSLLLITRRARELGKGPVSKYHYRLFLATSGYERKECTEKGTETKNNL